MSRQTLLTQQHALQCLGTALGFVLLRSIATTHRLPPQADEASLYVHWPYCLKRCSYCNFNKYIPRNQNHAVMTACLQRETQTLLQLSQVSRISSVFFGGGTPSLAQPSTIAAVLETVSKHAHLSDEAEVTLEVNPTPAGKASLKDFTLAGVNRFSVGIQSLNDDHLRTLGRDHDSQHALWTVSEARTLCPGRVSVDVMFALPGQSVKSWESELEKLLPVCDDHVSLYQLTLERGTQLFKQVDSGELSVPGDDVTAVMYNSARGVLEKAGFRQYEVSNFAKNNAVSEHNIGYWKGRQYIGVGPGAHGRFVLRAVGGVQREARTQTLEPDVWIREVQRHGHGTRRRIQLDHHGLLEEVLVMGLRMNEGITQQHWKLFSPEDDLQQIFGMSEKVQEFQAGGLLKLNNRGLRCSWEGLALLDSILPTMLLELEMFFKKQYTSRKTDIQRDR
ncbi:radical S-adenosyl methionine domain-containing protein 1, mitochondrial isoform X1 [Sinocyclocheilus rhinocerous]|uniref:radical S-adenosyl methionine domain-containing protein 1, mitochondrial isoform X1 n=1 Tax=Sinocyclocheilus rhinocerous TaxID=307959 RepID=UPI0007B7E14B|nr:PREDICTED: radical S-adenosyl methionine domain-containing protein 1, mitochondrial-like isoform X1 [Sinocyclocheilus rhinocerous]